MEQLTIGRLAKLAGIGVETIRFYERKGLVNRPPRKDFGYRQYPLSAVGRIRFIKRAKDLGFSLKEVSELLNLRVDPQTTCADVKSRAEKKIEDVSEKIMELQRIQNALGKLAASCHGDRPTGECPILEALDREEG